MVARSAQSGVLEMWVAVMCLCKDLRHQLPSCLVRTMKMTSQQVQATQPKGSYLIYADDPPSFACLTCGRIVPKVSVVLVGPATFMGHCNRGCGAVEVAPRVTRVTVE